MLRPTLYVITSMPKKTENISRESAVALFLLAWWQAVLEAAFFEEDWGGGVGADNGEAQKRAFHRWDARLTLAASDCGEDHRPC